MDVRDRHDDKETDGRDGHEDEDNQTDLEDQIHKYILGIWNNRRAARNVLVSVTGGTKIFTNTVKYLQQKISDEIIDAFMAVNIEAHKSPIQYIKCSVMALMLDPSQQHTVIETVFSASKLIGVCNLRGQHWVLCVIDMEQKVIYIMDPIEKYAHVRNSCLLVHWKSFLQMRGQDVAGWRSIVCQNSRQPDMVSCGIICLMLASHYIKQGTVSCVPVTALQVEGYRLHVLKTIILSQDIQTVSNLCRFCYLPDTGKRQDNWVGCDRCDVFWIHTACIKPSDKIWPDRVYICPFCL
ncbi:uncharacterized protein [Argopecten irradians]|uniref:uncharacterized protein n=1 Tax=Argopecten irradians TaxID=31199 RepID=UPI003713A1EF